MGIIWLASVATMLIVVFSGVFYRYDPFHHVNYSANVATALADNLQTVAMTSVMYSVNNKLTTPITLNSNLLSTYLPNNFKYAIPYNAVFSQDQFNNKWVILSYNTPTFRGVQDQSLGEDILRSLVQRVNNKGINNQNNYQLVYTGINVACNINSVLQPLTINLQQSFSYVCSNNSSSMGKYILMVPVNYY